MPAGSRQAILWSPTANLDNEIIHCSKDAENSHEKDIETLHALVNENTTSSTLATIQRLFRLLRKQEECRHSPRVKSHYNNEATN